MTAIARLRRHQILREAEGYLDLILSFDEQSESPQPVRDRIALRCIATLDRLGIDEQRGHANYLRGQAMRVMNRYADAIKPLRQAASDAPSEIHIWLALGWCYKRVGRLDLAIDALEKALVVDPSQAIISYNLACYWSLARDCRRAVDYLGRAFDLDPQYRGMAEAESDFDPIRQDPTFLALTSVNV